MKYAAFADLFDTKTAHIVEFEMSDLRQNRRKGQYELNPSKIKNHYVFLGRSSDIKRLFSVFILEESEIKDTYEESQRDMIDAIFGQND